MQGKKRINNVIVHSVIPPMMKDEIKKLVEAGHYMSESDFIRQAIREKLGDN